MGYAQQVVYLILSNSYYKFAGTYTSQFVEICLLPHFTDKFCYFNSNPITNSSVGLVNGLRES